MKRLVPIKILTTLIPPIERTHERFTLELRDHARTLQPIRKLLLFSSQPVGTVRGAYTFSRTFLFEGQAQNNSEPRGDT